MQYPSSVVDRHRLHANFLKQHARYLQAVKEKRSSGELRVFYSELQELYNQLEALKEIHSFSDAV